MWDYDGRIILHRASVLPSDEQQEYVRGIFLSSAVMPATIAGYFMLRSLQSVASCEMWMGVTFCAVKSNLSLKG